MWEFSYIFQKKKLFFISFHLYLSSFSLDALTFSFIFSFIFSLLFSSLLFSSLLFSSLLFSSLLLSLPLPSLAFLSCLSFSVSLPLSLSVPVCPCLRVLLWWWLLCLVRMSLWSWCACGVVWFAENLRVYIQNVPVCTGTTPACSNTCGRGARTHRDVLIVHTGGVFNGHTGRGVGEGRGEGEGEERGQRDTPTPTPTPTPTHFTTHNTEYARCHRQFCLPKFAHVRLSVVPRGSPKKPFDLTHFQFENRSRTTCSRFLQSFALPDKVVQLQLS